MFIFNTTFSVNNSVYDSWKAWMKRNYIPVFKDLAPKVEVDLFEVMAVIEEDSTNYSCQIRCNTPDELEVVNKYSTALLGNLTGEMKNKCLSFSSILKRKSDF